MGHKLHTRVPAAALQEGAGQTLGWLTTNSRKETMCFQLREALRIGNLAFSSQFFSTASTAGEAKLQLDDELVRCSVSTIRMQNQIMNVCVSSAAKFLRSSRASTDTVRKGKEDLFWKGRRSQDDLSIALQLAITGVRAFYQSDRYSSFRSSV